jgi:molybdopterin converting factor small subunit
MGVTIVCVRGPLRALAGGRTEHELDGLTVVELLRAFEARHSAASGWIVDGERGDEATAVNSGGRVDVVPAITGG